MKLSRQPFLRTTNRSPAATPAVKAKVHHVGTPKEGSMRVESPTDVTTRPPWSCPESVIAVSEGGDAEVTLGTALAMLELEDSTATAEDCDDSRLTLVTPEKGNQEDYRREDGEGALFLGPASPSRGSDHGGDPHHPLAPTRNLLDCDLSSYYESPLKTSALLDRSTLSASTVSPAFVLLMDEGETPEKVPTYCGLVVCNHDHEDDHDDGVPMSAVDLQARIARFLGAPGSDAPGDVGGWQRMWSEGKAADNTTDNGAGEESDGEREELHRRLQSALVHRIHRQQAAHVGRLKGRTQPFGRSSGPCHGDAHLKQRRARSFQVQPTSRNGLPKKAPLLRAPHLSRRRGGAPAGKGATHDLSHVDHVFPLWTCGMNCGTLTDDEVSPVLKSRKRYHGSAGHLGSDARFTCHGGSDDDDDEDECYDSDPETFTATKVLFHDNKENIPPLDDCDRRSHGHHEPSSSSSTLQQVVHDDPSAQVVWEMFNGRFTLVLQQHHSQDTTFSLPSDPQRSVAVHGWLERGQQLRSRILPPTLVWQEIDGERRLTSISLLDIVRIFEAELLLSDDQLMRHALARTSHTICIQTLDSSILVGAESRSERDRLVHGLKVVVARLGSFLLCNDDRLLDEFFLSTPESLLEAGRNPFEYDDEDSDDDFEMHDV